MRYSAIFACLLLTLAGAFPLLVNRGLPQGSDIDIHYWRTFEIENSLAHGDIFGLWAEHFYSGYGSPIFQYQAPGFYVLAALVGKLPFVDNVARLNLVWVLSIAMGVFGVYVYAARRWGAKTGLVCAASFVFAPAILFNEPIGRGSYPVSLALGCLAMSLACLDRYASEKRFGWPAALSLFGLLWSHNLTAVTGAGLLLAWFIWQAIFHRQKMPYLYQAFVLFLLSCGTAAFFWLPLLMQRGDVQLDRLYAGENLNFNNYFQPLGLLLSPAALLDTGLYYQKERYSLGIVSVLLAAGSLFSIVIFRLRRMNLTPRPPLQTERGSPVTLGEFGQETGFARFSALSPQHPELFWLIIAAVTLFLVLPQSRPLWESIAVMRFFQFPPRFLNYTALALALSAGGFVQALVWRYRYAWLVLLVGLIIQGWQSIPWRWLPDYQSEATSAAFFEYEMQSGASGTTGTNEYLPSGVVNLPAPTSFVMDSLAQHHPALRVNQHQYSPGTTVEPLENSPLRYRVRVIAPQATTLEIFMFYFPGWSGTVDGEPVSLRLAGESGFIALDVTAGEHIVQLNYALSPLRIGAIAISVLCAVLITGWLWWHKNPVNESRRENEIERRDLLIFAALMTLLLAGGTVMMRPGIAWYDSAPGQAQTADFKYQAQFGNTIKLAAYDWLNVDDRQIRLALYWHFDLAVDTRLNSFVHLVDGNGQIVAQRDKPGFAGVTLLPGWSFRLMHRDVYMLDLPPNLPPGDYRVRVGVWRCLEDVPPEACSSLERLPVVQDGQQAADAFIFLPQSLKR